MMKNCLSNRLGVFVVILLVGLVFSGPQAEASGFLSGTVRDATGTPLDDVGLYIYQTGGSYSYYDSTNASGEYSRYVEAGDYYVRASLNGYVGQYYGGKMFEQEGPSLASVPEGGTTSGIDITLPDGNSISGTIRDVTGNPLDYVGVEADTLGSPNVWWYPSADSDASGKYRLSGLPPRNTRLVASYYRYVRNWYDGQLISDDAEILTLTDTTHLTGIDFTMRLGGTLRAVVMDQSGLPVYNPSSETLPDDYVRDIVVDSGDDLWLGTDAGLMGIVDGATIGVHVFNSDLPGNSVRSIAADGSGNRYYATDLGIARHTIGGIEVYDTTNSSLPEDDCTAVVVHPSGDIYIGTEDSQFVRWNGSMTFTSYSYVQRGEASQTAIRCLGVNLNTNDVYIGSEEGMTVHDPTGGGFTNYTASDGLPSYTINAIEGASDGTMWVGTSSGLYRIWPSSATATYTTSGGLVDNYIRDLFVIDGSHVWIATANGASYFNGTNFTNYSTSLGNLTNNDCRSICQWQGRTYIGQTYGMDVLSGGTLRALDRQNLYASVRLQIPELGLDYSGGDSNRLDIDVVGLPTGSYRAYSQPSYYSKMYYDNTFLESAATLISVTEGQTTEQRYVFLMQHFGSISGSANDHLSSPLSSGTVYAFRAADLEQGETASVSSGAYTLHGLAPGDYYVCLKNSSYPTLVYPSAFRLSDASVVTVTSAQETTGIDFNMLEGSDATIAGRARDAAGNPYQFTDVYARQVLPSSSSYSGDTDKNGDFTFTVPPGNYQLYMQRDDLPSVYHASTFDENAYDLVEVGDGAAVTGKNITVPTYSPGGIAGKIVDQGGTPVVDAEVNCSGSGVEYPATNTNASGDFEFQNLPPYGEYTLEAGKEGYVDASVTLDGVPAGSTVSSITLTLEQFTPVAIEGTVYDASGEPLWNVELQFTSTTFPSYQIEVETDWDGFYRVEAFPQGDVDVRVDKYGYIDGVSNGISLSGGTNPFDFVLDFDLGTRGMIQGRVTDLNGHPVPGVYLYASGPTSRWVYANGQGDYTMGRMNAGTYTVQLSSFSSDSTPVTGVVLGAGEIRENVDLVINKALGTISGTVRDTAAQTIPYPSMNSSSFSGGSYPVYFYTNASGEYMLCGLLSGTYAVSAAKEGYVEMYYGGSLDEAGSTRFLLGPSEDVTGIDIELPEGQIMTGTVTDAYGHPLRNASIYAESINLANFESYDGTDDFGMYRIDRLAPGPYEVRVSKNNYYSEYYNDRYTAALADTVDVVTGTPQTGIDFEIGVGGGVSGEATNDSAVPYTSGTIYAYYEGDASNSTANDSLDASGQYEIQGLKPGNYHIRASISGKPTIYYDGAYSIGTAMPVAIVDETITSGINFVVPETIQSGTISGTITDPVGDPLASVSVRCTGVDGTSGSRSTSTSASGAYQLTNVGPGSWVVYVQESNVPYYYYGGTYDEAAATRVVVTPDSHETGIDIQTVEKHYAVFQGTVRDLTGTAISGVSLTLNSNWSNYSTTSMTDGTYFFPTVFPSDNYSIEAGKPGYYTKEQTGINVPPDDTVTVDLTLTDYSPCIAQGYVRNVSGSPLAGVGVNFTGLTVDYSYSAYTDVYGDYIADMLPPGDYRVYVSSSGYEYQEYASVPLAPGSPVERNFVLDFDSGYGVVAGRVVDASGAPVFYARVYSEGPSYRNVYTDVNGYYQIPRLSAGTYRIYMPYEDDSGDPEQTGVEVTAGEVTAGVDFTLSVLYGTISGTIRDLTGEPVRLASIYGSAVGHSDGPSSITSGTQGQYIMPRVRTDGPEIRKYKIYASKNSYVTTYYDGTPYSDDAEEVLLNPGQSLTGIDISLPKGAGFTGRVTDHVSGNPITTGYIRAQHRYFGGTMNYSGYMDSSGIYRFDTLPAGDYILYSRNVTGYVRQYYNGAYYFDDADQVQLATGELKTGFDFSLRSEGSISGLIDDASGTPYTSGTVYAYETSRTADEAFSGYIQSPSGAYEINDLPGGSYYVYASVSGKPKVFYQDAYFPADATPVTVNWGANTRDIDITVPQTVENGSIAGTMYDELGQPYASVSVRIYGVDGSSGSYSRNTAADGTYQYDNLQPGTYVVGLQESNLPPYYYGNTYDQAAATRIPVNPGQAVTGINVTAPTKNYASVSGTIRDQLTQPVADVSLSLSWNWSSYNTTTDSAGDYTFPQVFPQDDITLSAQKVGYFPNQMLIDVPAGATLTGQDLTLTSYNGGAIAGTVTDASGHLLEGASLSITHDGSGYSQYGSSDQYGTYRIDNLPPGSSSVSCSLTGYNYQPIYDVNIVSGTTTVLDIVMVPSSSYGRVSGQIVDASGRPAARIRVQSEGPSSRNTYTALDGTYVIPRLSAGTYRIYLPYESAPGNEQTGISVVQGSDTTGIDFTLNVAYGAIQGTVTESGTGDPLYAMTITGHAVDGSPWLDTSYSDKDGNYYFGRVPLDEAGGHYIWCYGQGYVQQYWQEQEEFQQANPVVIGGSGQATSKDFVMEKGAKIAGTITDATGNPLSSGQARAYWMSAQGSPSYSDYCDSSGRYEITGLAGGVYKLRFTSTGYITEYYDEKYNQDAGAEILLVTGTSYTYNEVLDLGGRISGQVTSSTGVPITSGNVYAEPQPSGSSTSDGLDSGGNYEIIGLMGGDYKVRVYASNYIQEYWDDRPSSGTADIVTIATGALRENINFALQMAGRVTGTVKDASGSPYTSGTVYLSSPTNPGSSLYSDGINSSGVFEMNSVRPGQYYAYLYLSGKPRIFYPYAFNVADASALTVLEGKTLSGVDFSVPQSVATCDVSGKVTRDGAAVSCYVYMQGVDGYTDSSSDYTDSNTGEFSMSGRSAGTYVFYANIDDYPNLYYGGVTEESLATRVTLLPGASVSNINIEVPTTTPNYASVSGTVYDQLSRPVPGAKVRLDDTYQDYTVYSGPDGTFRFSEVLAGTYDLEGSKAGYYETSLDDLLISEGETLTGQDLTLTAFASGAFAGRIYCASGQVISNAYLNVNGVDVTYNWGANNDEYGYYYAAPLPPGTYNLAFSKDGYQGYNLNGVALLAGQTLVQDVTMDFQTGYGVITGTVQDASGNPAFRIYVRSQGATSRNEYTDQQGRYVLARMNAGSNYRVYCSSEPNVPEVTGITVAVDEITSGVDLTLPVTYATIEGTVRNATGDPIYRAELRGDVVSGSPDPDAAYTSYLGTYAMARARTEGGRDYKVYAQKSPYARTYYANAPYYSEADLITLSAGQVRQTGIDITLSLGSSVSGEVLNQSSAPIVGCEMYITQVGGDGNGFSYSTDEGGRFFIEGLTAGPYKLRARASGYVTEYYDNKYTYDLGDEISVVTGTLTPDIDFQLRTGGSVSGVVADTAGLPIAGVNVYADSPQTTSCYGQTQTNGTGEYLIQGLYTDTYRVYAQRSGYQNAYRYNISVTDNQETENIDLMLYQTGESTHTPTPTLTPTATFMNSPTPTLTPTITNTPLEPYTPTPTPTGAKPGDLDFDEDVDAADLQELMKALKEGNKYRDLNGDGEMDYKDLLWFSEHWQD